MVTVAGVLLAAGRGERFGGDKLLAPVRTANGAAVAMGVASLRALACAVPVVVAVVRPGADALARLLADEGARVVVAERAGEGMGASLAAGVAALDAISGCVVALADMPWIRPATHRAVAAAIASGATVAAARYHGTRGHPVGFGPALRGELLQLEGDEGARRVLAAHRDLLRWVDVDDPGVLLDVDVPGELAPPDGLQ